MVGLLVIYCLFLYDASRTTAWEALDDVIYYTRAVVRCLEFLVAVFVVCAGFHESLVGQWSWSNSAVLVVHCYFNVWQRLQTGWVSFLRRREAAKHIDALPAPNEEQLAAHNDVCAICYQAMTTSCNVRITSCRHLYHGSCLRKWLYVQEKCPMCSTPITTNTPADSSQQSQQDPAARTAASVPAATISRPSGHLHEGRKVHFSLDQQQQSSGQSAEGSEEMEEGSQSQFAAGDSAGSTSFTNQNFDTLLHLAQNDLRLSSLRVRSARHSRSKSESLARILE